MKLILTRLSAQKGSSISASFPIELNSNESLVGFRASAYIKALSSGAKIICVFDASINVRAKTLDISVGPPRCAAIPAGQLVYYVELSKGISTQIIERNYLNIEP